MWGLGLKVRILSPKPHILKRAWEQDPDIAQIVTYSKFVVCGSELWQAAANLPGGGGGGLFFF